MPDNKNPPKDDQPQKQDDQEEKISRRGQIIECQHPDCNDWAISLSPYCWKHIKDKKGYRKKIQEWARAEKSMERFILNDADLSGLLLKNNNLTAANLGGVNLSGADIWRANLSWVNFCLADLSNASISKSNLSGAELWRANLSGAWLAGADLTNAYLIQANLTGVRGLYRRNFSKQLTEKEKEKAEEFKESYMTVKNYFMQSGRYDDASWAAFRERTLERIAWYNALKKMGLLKALRYRDWRKTILKWFGSKIISLLNGYGERPWRVIISSGVIVTFFSIIYYIFKCIQSYPMEKLHRLDYLYFSIVTFTTLGYGDIRPLAAPWARLVASGEAFIGAFMIALFVWTLARRYVAR